MALLIFVDVGLVDPPRVTGLFCSLFGLSWTVESGCWISPTSIFLLLASRKSKLAGLAGWKADLTTSIGSSSDSSVKSFVELTSDECSFDDLLSSGLFGGLMLCLLLVGDNLTLNASADDTLLCKLLPKFVNVS